ncbi:MAG: phage baseplate assembly protein V [Eubacteriales bacterium]|nr:phage baseplate assembly protein V [Eubacteriales bacterium]
MGFYDIMDEIAAKQALKTDTGDNRMFGVTLGVVTKNYEKTMPGCVCVRVPVRDEDANELKWARVAMPSSGRGWGHYFLPEAGDQVLLAFEQGNIEKPYVVGCIPKDSNSFLTKSVKEKNQLKRIVTKNGSTIEFEDAPEGEGTKDKISVYTAGEAHRVILDNEKNQILVSDKDGRNQIELKTETGNMRVLAEKKLTIQVGDNIEITLNGSSGTVSVSCSKLKVEASGSININSSGAAKLGGANVSLSASGTLKAESSGVASLSGAPVKIG